MEPAEALEVVENLKEANEHGTQSQSSISLAISILAILGALLVVLSHRVTQEASIREGMAKDTWEQYQVQRGRTDALRMEVDMLTYLAPSNANKKPTAEEAERAAAINKRIADCEARIARYSQEKINYEERGQALEGLAARAERQIDGMSFGQAVLQIAIILASITLYTRRRLFFFAGLAFGALGVSIDLYYVFFV